MVTPDSDAGPFEQGVTENQRDSGSGEDDFSTGQALTDQLHQHSHQAEEKRTQQHGSDARGEHVAGVRVGGSGFPGTVYLVR